MEKLYEAALAGVKVLNAPCCEVSTSSKGQCIPGGTTCTNRTEFAFWDNIHPTDIVYNAISAVAYNAVSPLDSYPFDIHTLLVNL